MRVAEGSVRQVIPFAGGGLGAGFGVGVRSELAAALGARVDRDGYLQVDQRQETTVPGLYAAVSLNEERWPV